MFLPEWAVKEIRYRKIEYGDKGGHVKRLQEWLTLHGFYVNVDGVFGPATRGALLAFKKSAGVPEFPLVDENTWGALTSPMTKVLSCGEYVSIDFASKVEMLADCHAKQHPREVGGQNRGPWVRLYMKGLDGKQMAWCAGFVSFIIHQAAHLLGIASPLKYTFSVENLVKYAKHRGLFIHSQDDVFLVLKPGYLFVNRRKDGTYSHVGIVTSQYVDHFETIEGNTNDDGSREGYKVCRRIRSYANKDFISLEINNA